MEHEKLQSIEELSITGKGITMRTNNDCGLNGETQNEIGNFQAEKDQQPKKLRQSENQINRNGSKKMSAVSRRQMICASFAAGAGIWAASGSRSEAASSIQTASNSKSASLGDNGRSDHCFDTFSYDGEKVCFYSSKIKKRTRIMILSDTHLFMDDLRGEPFRQFSGRMSNAYNHTEHFKTKRPTDPRESFEKSLLLAKKSGDINAIAILGDLVSFPTEAGIEWACRKLNECGLPWFYISGNHDWHYEGMTGSEKDLRAQWIQKRLLPLYQGRDPLACYADLPGVRLVMIDDSIYEILPEQLEFFKQRVDDGVPMVLMMHIPLFAPGRSVGFGCGHPDWNAETDRNWKIERRERWPEKGHSAVTMEFYRSVFTAPNLLGVFAGHIHRASLDVINGKPQFVVPGNFNQAFMTADFLPVNAKNKK